MWPTAVSLALAAGPADDLDRFFVEYAPHWGRITTHLWRNVRVSGRVVYRDTGGPPTHTVAFSAVAGDTVTVRRQTRTPAGSPPEPETAVVITPDQAVMLDRNTDSGRWRLWRQVLPWATYGAIQNDLYYSQLGGGDPIDYPVVGPYIGYGPNAYYRPRRGQFPGETTVRRYGEIGTEVIELRSRTVVEGGELVRLVRVRAADWLVTTIEELGSVRYVGETPTVVLTRLVYDLSYRPAGDGGLPFPATIRSRRIEPDGTERPGTEVEFTEYRRYTPAPEELDPARLFGVELPNPGPRPLLPPPGDYLPSPPDTMSQPTRPAPEQLPPPPPASNPINGPRLLLVGGGTIAIVLGGVAVARRRAESSRSARPSNG